MNHVVIVRKDKIEKIEMAENLRRLVSLISKPVDSNVLSNLIENRNDNDDSTMIQMYYENVVRLMSIGEEYSDSSAFYKYYNVQNVLGEWFDKIRHAMTIVAKECGEEEIANHVKPSSGIHTYCELSLLYNCKSLELNTFNIITILSDKTKAKLIVRDDGIEHHVVVNDSDVILVTSGVDAIVKAEGRVEILTVYPKPVFNSELRDKRIEDYLKGNTTADSQINGLLDGIMCYLEKPAR